MSIFWLIATVLLAIIEAATMGLTSIWFACGSLAAMIAAILGAGLWVQIALFIVVSAVLLLFTRPVATKYLKLGKEKTNADRVVGKTGVVIETIDNEKAVGLVRVDGQMWTARSVDGAVIAKDTEVKIDSISGVKLMVEPALKY